MNNLHPLRRWQGQIEPFAELWRSVILSFVTVNTEKGWLCLMGCLDLSSESSQDKPSEEAVYCDENVKALRIRSGLAAVPNVLSQLEQGFILPDQDPHSARLWPASKDMTYGSWQEPLFLERRHAQDYGSLAFSTIRASYSGLDWREYLPIGGRNQLDRKLRMYNPPIAGLDGLARSLGLVPLGPYPSSTYFEVRAQLPLRFGAISQNFSEKTLEISVELPDYVDHSKASVSVVFSPSQMGIALGSLKDWSGSNSRRSFKTVSNVIPIGDKSGSVYIVLGFSGEQVETHEHFIGSSDPWLRACRFFDPEFQKSKELLGKSDKPSVSSFELGVLRMFSLLGLRTIWFGKASAERKPDILAFHEQRNGGKTILVIECTEENPAAKFTKLKREAEALEKFLNDSTCQVLPVIVVAGAVSGTESQNAIGHRISLIEVSDLEKFLEKVERELSLERIIQFLESRRSAFGGEWLLLNEP